MRKVENEEIKEKLLIGLKAVSAVAEKNQIDYFVGWGNALGKVRHGGFIPWDDDIDLCFTRENFNKIISLYENRSDIIPYGFELQTASSVNPLVINRRSAKLRLRGIDSISAEMNDAGLGDVEKSVPSIDFIPLDRLPNSKLMSRLIYILSRYASLVRYYSLPKSASAVRNRKSLTRYRIAKIIPNLLLENINKLLILILENSECTGNYFPSIGDLYPGNHEFSYEILYPTRLDYFEGILIRFPNKMNSYLERIYGKNYMSIPEKEFQLGHWNDTYTNKEIHSLFEE